MKFYIFFISAVFAFSCVQNKNPHQTDVQHIQENAFEVTEVVQASGYTYLKVKENSEEKWMAVAKQEIQVGDVYFYDEALQMTNFHSKDLDRHFEEVYFVNQISTTPIMHHPAAEMHGMGGIMNGAHSGKIEPGKKSTVQLEKTNSETTIAQVYGNSDNFLEKDFEIRGIVVKVNNGIMGKNWVHIQDGTDSNGKFDLTITTQDLVATNDEVTFRGKISVNKDFGSGYFYELIMEDAVLAQ